MYQKIIISPHKEEEKEGSSSEQTEVTIKQMNDINSLMTHINDCFLNKMIAKESLTELKEYLEGAFDMSFIKVFQ